jgi:SAM-dependent methyltransferase
MKKIQLNLGCGIGVKSGFINVDKFYTLKQLKSKKGIFKKAIMEKGGTYVQADMCNLPFKDNYADYIETVNVIEHISFRNIEKAFSEMYRVLKPGHKVLMLTTNFDQLAKFWTEKVAGKIFDNKQIIDDYFELTECIYGNQLYEGEYHIMPFNPYFLNALLQRVGFKAKKIKIVVFPMGSNQLNKKLKTQKWEKNAVARTEFILVEAIK